MGAAMGEMPRQFGVALVCNLQLLCVPIVLMTPLPEIHEIVPYPWSDLWLMFSFGAASLSATGLRKMKRWACYAQTVLFLGHCLIGPFAVPRALWLAVENDGI